MTNPELSGLQRLAPAALSLDTTAGGNGHGFASGYSVRQTPRGWAWSAYGPLGGGQGLAPTRAEAERRAQAEQQAVSRPHGATSFVRGDRLP
jgi:hypothetical protein